MSGILLYVLPLPVLGALIVALAKGDLSAVLGNGIAAILFYLGAASMRRGLALEDDYENRSLALPPKIPFKLLGTIAVTAAVAVTAYYGVGHSIGISLSFAVGAFFGCFLTYGLDPNSKKGLNTEYAYHTHEEVISALRGATSLVDQIEASNVEIQNQEMHERLERIVAHARKILKLIEEDPRDLRRARKFLNTYLEGTQRITEGYVKMAQQTRNELLAENFRNVLVTIEQVFEEQHNKLLENEALDLDVKIEVLQTQLKKEGVM